MIKRQQILTIVQIATGITVVLGLILVLIELRQAKALTLTELASQSFSEYIAVSRTIMGENAADIIAKSCISPASLATADLVVLDAYYSAQIAQISRMRITESIGEFGMSWQGAASNMLIPILSTVHGRRWFAINFNWDSELMQVGNDLLALDPDCRGFLDRWSADPPQVPEIQK